MDNNLTGPPFISVVVHTYQEETKIERCLTSVAWADEIVVVDMESQDRTREIATRFTDRIYLRPWAGHAEPARAFGLAQARHEWVLVVDADEVVPPALSEQLRCIASNHQYDVVWIPRRNYFFGYEMKGTGWGLHQDKQLRFFRKSCVTWGEKLHSFPEIKSGARVGVLMERSQALLHFSCLDVEHFIEKLNRYTTIEAKERYQRGKKFSLLTIVAKMIKESWGRFCFRGGYRDGWIGFGLAMLMGVYYFVVGFKWKLMRDEGTE